MHYYGCACRNCRLRDSSQIATAAPPSAGTLLEESRELLKSVAPYMKPYVNTFLPSKIEDFLKRSEKNV